MPMANEDRRHQLPWVALGLTVTLTAAIIFALWGSSLSNRTAVAVANRDIPTGSTVEIDDLRAVEVASGQGAAFVPIADLDTLVGRTVQAAIPEGTILHPGLLSANSPIDAGMAVVGVVLLPGEYPIDHLGPGQPVGVVMTGDCPALECRAPSNAIERDPMGVVASTGIATTTTRATVAEVSEVLDSGRDALFVSLLTAAGDAELISRAAAANELRLILLPRESQSATSQPTHQQTEATAAQ